MPLYSAEMSSTVSAAAMPWSANPTAGEYSFLVINYYLGRIEGRNRIVKMVGWKK